MNGCFLSDGLPRLEILDCSPIHGKIYLWKLILPISVYISSREGYLSGMSDLKDAGHYKWLKTEPDWRVRLVSGIEPFIYHYLS